MTFVEPFSNSENNYVSNGVPPSLLTYKDGRWGVDK